jgi:guanylate kinase
VNPFPIVLSAPSGGGKTTVTRQLMQRRTDIGYSVSCTTRAPRAGEVQGTDYLFVTDEEFTTRRTRGEFAEWAVVHDRLYGTLKVAVQRVLDSGRHVMMDIDVQGAAQVALAYPDAVLIFMLPPSVQTMVDRLRERHTENSASLLTRLKSARRELDAVQRYQYVVVNDDLEAAVDRVSSIVDAEEVRRERVRALDTQVDGLIERLEHEITSYTAKA